MKKLCLLVAMICCFTLTASAAFADSGITPPEQIEIENPGDVAVPCYDTINTTLISYDITGSTAGVYTKLTTKNVGITSAKVKIQLIKSNGTVTHTYTGTMTKKNSYTYTLTKNFSLSSTGSYYAKVTFYTYKSGVLKETVVKNTGYKTYS